MTSAVTFYHLKTNAGSLCTESALKNCRNEIKNCKSQ